MDKDTGESRKIDSRAVSASAKGIGEVTDMAIKKPQRHKEPFPADLEAERAILSCVLQRPDTLDAALEIIGPEDFSRGLHRSLFDGMRRLANIGVGIDAVTLRDELSRFDGPQPTPQDMVECVVEAFPSLMGDYCRIVKGHATRRRIVHLAQHWSNDAREGMDPAELLGKMEYEVTDLLGDHTGRMGIRAKSDDMHEILREAEEGKLAGWSTGLHQYDDLSGGFYAGDFVIVAGPTSIGKSILALNLCEHFAFCRRRAAYFSIEMPLHQLIRRMLASRSGVSLDEVRRHGMNEEWRRVLGDTAKTLGPVLDDNLELWDVRQFTPSKFRVLARAAKSRGALAIVCVDFIQLMEADDDATWETKEREMAHIAQGMKAVARELGIVVIGVSQLNLQWVTQQRRPTKEDLKYSSAIEQAADTILILCDEKPEKGRYSSGRLMLIVDKQRNGATAHFYLRHPEGRFRFEEDN